MSWQKGLILTQILFVGFVISIIYLHSGSSFSIRDPIQYVPASANEKHKSSWTNTYNVSFHKSASVHTKHLVIAKMSYEDEIATWLESDDLNGAIPKVYTPDDPTALLHVPANKGHEAMVYLTYLIDNYDELPDIAIFMHAHQKQWHQDGLLQYDAIEMVRRLSAEAVIREGYRNLRCEWVPGCPKWIRPKTLKWVSTPKPEEPAVAQTWSTFFPDILLPDVISQPCCGQFALSKDRMLSLPKSRYQAFRDWLLETDLSDDISGRVFEYLWAYIFTGKTVFCPDMRICYCEGYGVCFDNDTEFDYWFKLRWEWQQKDKQLREWKIKVGGLETLSRDSDMPLTGFGEEIYRKMASIQKQMDEIRTRATKRGDDPAFRAKVAGRTWKQGDGF